MVRLKQSSQPSTYRLEGPRWTGLWPEGPFCGVVSWCHLMLNWGARAHCAVIPRGTGTSRAGTTLPITEHPESWKQVNELRA